MPHMPAYCTILGWSQFRGPGNSRFPNHSTRNVLPNTSNPLQPRQHFTWQLVRTCSPEIFVKNGAPGVESRWYCGRMILT